MGHRFQEGASSRSPTKLRHCINGVALRFLPGPTLQSLTAPPPSPAPPRPLFRGRGRGRGFGPRQGARRGWLVRRLARMYPRRSGGRWFQRRGGRAFRKGNHNRNGWNRLWSPGVRRRKQSNQRRYIDYNYDDTGSQEVVDDSDNYTYEEAVDVDAEDDNEFLRGSFRKGSRLKRLLGGQGGRPDTRRRLSNRNGRKKYRSKATRPTSNTQKRRQIRDKRRRQQTPDNQSWEYYETAVSEDW